MEELKNKITIKKYSRLFLTISMLFAVCMVISSIAASKTFQIGIFIFTGAEFLFPVTYVINDIIAEVYGYNDMKVMIWTGLLLNIFSTAFLFFISLLAGSVLEYNSAFSAVFGKNIGLIGISISSFIAYLAGSFTNAFIMSKLKARDKEQKVGKRAFLSTAIGEFIDSLIFITFCCLLAPSYYSWSDLISLVPTITLMKIAMETIILPLTTKIIAKIKRTEGVSVIENEETNYNPFSFKPKNYKK